MIWSGPTPILAAALWAWSGSWWPLAIYIMLAAVLSVACILPLREAAGQEMGPLEVAPDGAMPGLLRERLS